MAAALYNLEISRGEDFNFTLRILDSLDQPVPFNLSLCKAEVREGHKKPLVASFVLSDLGDGTIKFALPSTVTKLLPISDSLKWDFFFADSIGSLSKLISGKVTLDPNISNV